MKLRFECNAALANLNTRAVSRLNWKHRRLLFLFCYPRLSRRCRHPPPICCPAPMSRAGTTINALFYFYSERDKQYLHGQRVLNHPHLDSGIWVGKFSHYFKLGENTANLALILPAGSLHGGKDTLALGRASGVGDATLVGGYWFVDKPETRKYVGITAFFTLPTGTYDKRKALNLGENRWKAVLQGAVNAGVSPKVDIDLDADVAVYGHNDEFGAAGATMTQDPSYQFQTFLRYHFSSAFDVASGVSYVWGGETQVNGIRKYNAARTSKLVLFGGYMFGRGRNWPRAINVICR